MSADAIIRVEGLGKRYRLGASRSNERYTALRDVISENVRGVFKKLKSEKLKSANGLASADLSISESQRLSVSDVSISESPNLSVSSKDEFWALKDVSFEVKQGEVLGIIGRNGAGKSTLLKILSRITEPTKGRIKIRGRVASLLEVGTGFHPELTGRENIFLNGAILGMHRSEIKAKFDEIVAFAEVEKFLDTPVKRYSSGMYVRLAFAVAAHLEPEILVVDEVLAVGDAEFQKKCLGKMESVATKEGRTVLFVSHNMGAVNQLCSRALLLSSGTLAASGTSEQMIKLYTNTVARSADDALRLSEAFRGPLAQTIRFTAINIYDSVGHEAAVISPSSAVRVELRGSSTADVPAFRITLAVFSNGVRLFSMHDVEDGEPFAKGSAFRAVFTIPAQLLRPGDYFLAAGGHSAVTGEWLWALDAAQFSVLEEWSEGFRQYDTGMINIAHRGERIAVSV